MNEFEFQNRTPVWAHLGQPHTLMGAITAFTTMTGVGLLVCGAVVIGERHATQHSFLPPVDPVRPASVTTNTADQGCMPSCDDTPAQYPWAMAAVGGVPQYPWASPGRSLR